MTPLFLPLHYSSDLLQARFSGWFSLLYYNMKCFVLSSLLSLSLAAPAPEATAAAEASPGYPLLVPHVSPYAVVPSKQLQWPGVSAPGLDQTCFGCRAHVVVPVGRKRRSAEAEAVAEATPEAEADAEAAAAAYYPLGARAVAPYYPYGVVPAVALHSSSYAAVNHAGVAYNTGVNAVTVVHGRRRRDAEADAEAEADADAYYSALNGYAHNLGSGHSFAAISSSPSLPYVHGVPAYPTAYGYPYPYLG